MSIFSAIGNAITGPFRGIGKLLQGDVGGMLGAFGDTVKVAAPFLAGPMGVPAAIGLGAAGGAAQTLDDPGNTPGRFLKGGVGGAAVGSLGGMGQWLANNASSIGGVAGSGAAPAGLDLGTYGTLQGGSPSLAGAAAAPSVAAAVPAVASAAAPAASVASGGGLLGRLSGIGKWLAGNAPLVTGLAGTGADIYGARLRSKEMDRQMAFQEEEARKQREQQQLQMLMSTMAAMRPRY